MSANTNPSNLKDVYQFVNSYRTCIQNMIRIVDKILNICRYAVGVPNQHKVQNVGIKIISHFKTAFINDLLSCSVSKDKSIIGEPFIRIHSPALLIFFFNTSVSITSFIFISFSIKHHLLDSIYVKPLQTMI